MSSMRAQFASLLMLAGLVCSLVSSSAQQSQEQGETLPLPPPSLTPKQRPSGTVIVTYWNGEITIEAFNANLRRVLHAVSSQIGAIVDIPPGAEEGVVGVYGPGPPRDVIATLLNGSRFNYVMLGSANDPTGLARLVLSPKPSDGAETGPVRATAQPVLNLESAERGDQANSASHGEPLLASGSSPPPALPATRHRRRR